MWFGLLLPCYIKFGPNVENWAIGIIFPKSTTSIFSVWKAFYGVSYFTGEWHKEMGIAWFLVLVLWLKIFLKIRLWYNNLKGILE